MGRIAVLLYLTVVYLTILVRGFYLPGTGTSYARYPAWNGCRNASISFEFRVKADDGAEPQEDGLLLYVDDGGSSGQYMALTLEDGLVTLKLKLRDQREANTRIQGTNPKNTGDWVRVHVERNRMLSVLTVDGERLTNITFASDFDFSNSGPVYFGGIPEDYPLLSLSYPSVSYITHFKGDIRNVLYGNCTCLQSRVQMVDNVGVPDDSVESCDRSDPCQQQTGEGCVCLTQDDKSSKCECSQATRCDTEVHYALNFENSIQDHYESQRLTLYNEHGLDAECPQPGQPTLRKSFHGFTLPLVPPLEYARIAGPSQRKECLGDLSLCPSGYTFSIWLMFPEPVYEEGVYISNGGHSQSSHGIAVLYGKGKLTIVFRLKNGQVWRTSYDNLLEGSWYHMAASWHQDRGLFLYINGILESSSPRAVYEGAVVGAVTDNYFTIGRPNENRVSSSELAKLGKITVDEFNFYDSFKDAAFIRNNGPNYKMTLSMNSLQASRVQWRNNAADARVTGTATLVDGKISKAMTLNSAYVVLNDGEGSCLTDLDKCFNKGLYISFWIFFNQRLGSGTYYLLDTSGSRGVSLFYQNGRLQAKARTSKKMWSAQWAGITHNTWYFVELSWGGSTPLQLFVNRALVASATDFVALNTGGSNVVLNHVMLIGRKVDGGATVPGIIDEVEIWFASRDALLEGNFIFRDKPRLHYWSMNAVEGNVNQRSSMRISQHRSPQLVNGKIKGAIQYNGENQYGVIRRIVKRCDGNLNYCTRGLTLSTWLRPGDLSSNEHYMSTGPNGIDLSLNNGRLVATAQTSTRVWTVSTNQFSPSKWQYIEISWHPEFGLKLYKNFKLIAKSSSFTARDPATVVDPRSSKIEYLLARGRSGRSPSAPLSRAFANMTIDELQVWQSDRENLLAFNFALRGKPTNYELDMDLISRQLGYNPRLYHPQLDIELFNSPSLVADGKINSALRLGGRQYADLGTQADKCLGNIGHCKHGYTLVTWLKFEDLEENSYVLSSGNRGVTLYYSNGKLRAVFKHHSDNQQWSLSADNIETGKWYLVDLSWHPVRGAAMFINDKLVSESTVGVNAAASSTSVTPHFYLGRANSGDALGGVRTRGAEAVLDEMEIWYGDRYYLVAHDYLQRGIIPVETISFEKQDGNTILHPRLDVQTVNGATLSKGKVGKAIMLNGNRQYVDLGDHSDKCYDNLDLCPFGLTVSMMVNPDSLEAGQTFLSGDAVNVFYRNGRTYAEFSTKDKRWTVSTTSVRPGQWNEIDLSWHPEKGLVMYVDGQRTLEDTQPETVSGRSTINYNMFIGRDSRGSRLSYPRAKIDEVQFWGATREVLQAHGYKRGADVYKEEMNLDKIENNKVENTKRQVTVFGNPQVVSGVIGQAVLLNGRNQYLDLGSNITCLEGNMEGCLEGYTLRMRVNPQTLESNTYLVSSQPLDVYYKNSKLYAVFRTADKVWITSTDKLESDEWNLLDITWDNENGVRIFKDSKEVGEQMFPERNDEGVDVKRHFYIGRSNTDTLNEKYLDAKLDDVQIWNAKRDILVSQGLFTEPNFTWIYPPDSRKGFVRFDFTELPDKYTGRNTREEMHVTFKSNYRDGLIWLNGDENQKAFLTLKDGNLVLVFDYGNNVNDTIVLRPTDGSRFSDNRVHNVVITRNGQNVDINVDEKYRTSGRTRRPYRFNNPSFAYIGGTTDTEKFTNKLVRDNFLGTLTNFKIIGDVSTFDLMKYVHQYPIPDDLAVKEKIIFIPELRGKLKSISSPVTFKTPEAHLRVPGWDPTQPDSNLSIAFTTVEPNGLLLYQPGALGTNDYLALELYDGKLHAVVAMDGTVMREEVSEKRVDDGRPHDTIVEQDGNALRVSLDPRGAAVLRSGITRRAVGNVARLYLGNVDNLNLGSSIYLGGYPGELPWHIWSRNGFVGCIERLDKDGDPVDLEGPFRQQNPRNAELRCLDMPDRCRSRPCIRGVCEEFWLKFMCDCSSTDYTDQRCNRLAPVGNFDGKEYNHIKKDNIVLAHVNDISMRFKTKQSRGTLLSTTTPYGDLYYRIDVEDGRAKITTNLGGETKTLYAGRNINDNNWHTLKVRRRANNLEFWVDDESSISTILAGKDYKMTMKDIYIGALMPPRSQTASNIFLGHVKNVIIDGVKYFDVVGGWPNIPGINITGKPPSRRETPQPLNPSTFKTPEAHVTLTQLTRGTRLALMFKTKEPNGLIMYNGPARGYDDFLALELRNGNLVYTFNTGGKISMIVARTRAPLNDDQWHYVEITQPNELKTVMVVDDAVQEIRNSASDPDFNFGGKLYLGGMPEDMYDELPSILDSRTGFKGCLASLDLDGRVPNLFTDTLTRHPKVAEGCGNFCDEDTCLNGGRCLPNDKCDCSLTSYTGEFCNQQENGFRIGEHNKPGMLRYRFPSGNLPSSTKDMVAFGFMTYDCNGVLFRAESEDKSEFIEARLENGDVVVEWRVGDTTSRIVERRQSFCDGRYHILRFERDGALASLSVDDLLPNEKISPDSDRTFSRISVATIGGKQSSSNIIDNPLNSIIAGLYFNGKEIIKLAERNAPGTTLMRDIRLIPPPFRLDAPTVTQTPSPPRETFCVVEQDGSTCRNYGLCLVDYCNCNFTAYAGPYCTAEPFGLYFGRNGQSGIGRVILDGGEKTNTDKVAIGFMTHYPNGVLYRGSNEDGQYLEVSMVDGYVVSKYDLGYGEQTVSSSEPFNDGEYHVYRFHRQNGNVKIRLDDFVPQVRRRSGIVLLKPQTSFNVGAQDYIRGRYIKRFNGILGGVNYNNQYILDNRNIVKDGDVTIATHKFKLVDIPKTFCTEDGADGKLCRHGGICVNGEYCDCSKTSYIGPFCNNYDVGYRYNTTSRNNIIKFVYAEPKSESIDELTFGFMTYDEDGTLVRIDNQDGSQYMEFRLVGGQLWLYYNMGNGEQKIRVSSTIYSDGAYRQVRLIRDRGTLRVFVGGKEVYSGVIPGMAVGGRFRDQHVISLGAHELRNGQLIRPFDGILAGVYYNGLRLTQLAKADASGITKVGGGQSLYVISPFYLDRPVIKKPVAGGVMGGGGAAWNPVVGAGGAGGEVMGLASGAGGAGMGGVGAAVAPAAAGVGGGAAAGVAVASILALLMLISSLIWAIYKCKPGLIPCCGTGAAAGAPVAGAASYPLLKGGVFGASAAGAGVGAGAGMAGAGAGAGGMAGAGASAGGMAGAAGAGMAVGSGAGLAVNGMAGGGGIGGGAGYSQFSASTINRQTVYDAADGSMVDGGMMMGEGGNIYDSNTLAHSQYNTSSYSGGGGTMGGTMGGTGRGNTMTSGFRTMSESASNYGGSGMGGGGTFIEGYGNTMGHNAQVHNYSTSSSVHNYMTESRQFGTMGGASTMGDSTQFLGFGGSVSMPFITLNEDVKVDCCLLTADGRHVVTGSCTGPPQVWNMANGELVTVMAGDDMNSTDLHLALNDSLLVGQVSTEQTSLDMSDVQASNRVPLRKLQIWDFESGQPLEMADGQMCSAIAMMSDGRRVVLGRTDKFGNATHVTIYDLMGNETLRDIRYDGGVGIADSVTCLHLSPDDRYVIAGFNNSYDGNANFVVFDLSVSDHIAVDPKIIALDAEPQCTAILDTHEAVTGTRKGELVIWSLRTGKPLRQLIGNTGGTMTLNRVSALSAHSAEIKDLTLSKDGRILVSASADGTLRSWSMDTEKLMHTLSGHKDEVWCCDISHDNEMILSGSRDSTIRLWRTRNGAPICLFNANMDIFSVKMSANAGTVVALGDKFASRKLIMLQIVHSRSRRH